MAWRLHDTIHVSYFNLTESNDNPITNSVIALNGVTNYSRTFSGFSEKWFDKFRDIYLKIKGNSESDLSDNYTKLIPFRYLEELSNINEHDTSGLDQHFKDLYLYTKNHLNQENENLHLLTLYFED